MNWLPIHFCGFLWFWLQFLLLSTADGHILDKPTKCFIGEGDVIASTNINNIKGCTKINGNVIFANDTFVNMLPSELEAFSTVKVIAGFLNIEAWHSDFKNLSFFRHLKVIGTSHLDEFYTLNIASTSLESLEWSSLRKIKGSAAVSILYNRKLCFADTIAWAKITDRGANVVVDENRSEKECESDGFRCDAECSDGCWGPGPDKCVNCQNYTRGNTTCVAECDESNDDCRKELMMDKPTSSKCSTPRNDIDLLYCEYNCPDGYFHSNNVNLKNVTCHLCDPECVHCHGLGPNKCYSCKNKKLFKSPQTFTCASKVEETSNCNQDAIDDLLYYCYDINVNSKIETVTVLILLIIIICAIILVYVWLWVHTNSQKFKYNVLREASNNYEEPTNGIVGIDDLIGNQDRTPGNNNLSETYILGKYMHYQTGAFGKIYRSNFDDLRKPIIIIQLINPYLIGDHSHIKERMAKLCKLSHSNLLHMSVCLLKSAEIMTMIELMPLGNIMQHIQTNRKFIRPIQPLIWCKQIAEGMDYLEQNGIVHGNLAARNILLDMDYRVKIKDFGRFFLIGEPFTSKKFFSCCRQNKKLKANVKCPHNHNFNHKSDVWAFGLTMYQLFSFGKDPWDFITVKEHTEFMTDLKWEVNIPCPKMCKPEMYRWLQSCWNIDASNRPNFADISSTLQEQCNHPIMYMTIHQKENLLVEIVMDSTKSRQFKAITLN